MSRKAFWTRQLFLRVQRIPENKMRITRITLTSRYIVRKSGDQCGYTFVFVPQEL